MNHQALIDKVNEQQCLHFLARMVQHKSYSETEGERELAAFMVDSMKEIGLEAELQPVVGERVNAIGRWTGTGGGKSLLFNGHVDTNPVSEGWTVDPWEGKIDDRFIYGIGCSNMKAGDAAYFCAVKTLKEAGVTLKGDVILTFVVGELQGGIGTYSAIQKGLKADYFVNAEPSDVYAVTMHAAAFGFTIELTGNTRHLSKREEAVDAIAAACDLIPRLNAMKFTGAKSEEHLSVNRCHIGVVHGALGRDLQEWRPPQVADFVRMRGSARYAPGQTQEGVTRDIELVLKGLEQRFPGLKTVFIPEEFKGRLQMPPFEVARTSRIVKAVNKAYEQVRGEKQPTGALAPTGYYGTDAGHLYGHAGMEGIVCGPGGRYNTMPDERVDIVDFINAVKIYMLVILDICEAE
jgi:acetylornithine deacetylase